MQQNETCVEIFIGLKSVNADRTWYTRKHREKHPLQILYGIGVRNFKNAGLWDTYADMGFLQ